jgi:peptide/nickel transport system permease protein
VREYPRLKHGGTHLGADEARRDADVGMRLLCALGLALLVWWALAAATAAALARAEACAHLGGVAAHLAQRKRFCVECGARRARPAAAVRLAAGDLLAADYHVFGTDKVGQDVLYQVLKSVRTALVIGLVTTLVMLPLSICSASSPATSAAGSMT